MNDQAATTPTRKTYTRKKKVIDDTDRYVGERIRILRNTLGISQTKVAEHLGLTFQQVQKYEKGTNRISPGRLQRLATLLGCEVVDFFPTSGGVKADGENPIHKLGQLRHGQRLAAAFMQVSPMMRLRIITLIEQIVLDKGRGR